MDVSFFDHRRVRQALTVLLLAGSLACIFPPKMPIFQWWAERAALVALSFLLLGIFFLIVNKSRLMFVCLGCSAAICFFKNEMNEKMHPTNFKPPLSQPVDTPFQNRIFRDSKFLKSTFPDESPKTRR